jgi:hypothetical protein
MLNLRLVAVGLVVSSFALVATLAAHTNSEPKVANSIGDAGGDQNLIEAAATQCPISRSSSGVGGSSASCTVTCKAMDFLVISVSSADGDASVYGNGQCGNARASCSGKQQCMSTSGSTAGSTTSGSCGARSREAWASPITLDCKGEPSGTVCGLPVCNSAPEEESDQYG